MECVAHGQDDDEVLAVLVPNPQVTNPLEALARTSHSSMCHRYTKVLVLRVKQRDVLSAIAGDPDTVESLVLN